MCVCPSINGMIRRRRAFAFDINIQTMFIQYTKCDQLKAKTNNSTQTQTHTHTHSCHTPAQGERGRKTETE